MNKDKELRLEVMQELDWNPPVNMTPIGLTIEDGVIRLSGDVYSLFEKMASGQVARRESGAAYPQPQYVAGLLVIWGRQGDALPPEVAHSAIAESWIDAPVTMRQDGPEIFLSARETEVLSLMAAGQSNQEIAEQLCLALNTVKRHAYNIYAKLDAKNRTQAVSKARRLGVIG